MITPANVAPPGGVSTESQRTVRLRRRQSASSDRSSARMESAMPSTHCTSRRLRRINRDRSGVPRNCIAARSKSTPTTSNRCTCLASCGSSEGATERLSTYCGTLRGANRPELTRSSAGKASGLVLAKLCCRRNLTHVRKRSSPLTVFAKRALEAAR